MPDTAIEGSELKALRKYPRERKAGAREAILLGKIKNWAVNAAAAALKGAL
jgi:hypothetical protein